MSDVLRNCISSTVLSKSSSKGWSSSTCGGGHFRLLKPNFSFALSSCSSCPWRKKYQPPYHPFYDKFHLLYKPLLVCRCRRNGDILHGITMQSAMLVFSDEDKRVSRNKRPELVSKCRHEDKYILANFIPSVT